MTKTCHGPPPPAELTNGASSLHLLSQGAEARVWLVTLLDPENNADDGSSGGGKQRSLHVGGGINVPHLTSFSQRPSPLFAHTSTTSASPSKRLRIICKERFHKKYRHPQLDATLTKSRTKAEARSLIRCQRAGIPCPNVLAVAHWSNNTETESLDNGGRAGNDTSTTSTTTSSCLFLEFVEGCTVRQYFEHRSGPQSDKDKADGVDGDAQSIKRPRRDDATVAAVSKTALQREERSTTVIDSQTLCVAHTVGMLVAKMHAAGVIHGDLTTSNIMLANPPWLVCRDGGSTDRSNAENAWKPQLVLIDFGLATSSTSTSNKTNHAATNANRPTPYKQQHNSEEKAVDLYVLERAFLSTHPESELLVDEVWRGYRSHIENSDCQIVDDNPGDEEKDSVSRSSISNGADATKAVFNRLEQVRMRGRKRECFG